MAISKPDEVQTLLKKDGTQRKRKKFVTPLRIRKEEKKRMKLSKHCVLNDDLECCKRKCNNQISKLRRKEINEAFWMREFEEQDIEIWGSISVEKVERRTLKHETRRSNSKKYFLKNEIGEKKDVCKMFFLNTFGFKANNDSFVRRVLAGKGVPKQKQPRGGGHNKIDKKRIEKHIESFLPEISHYRREHAPKRLYLPSDLSVTQMHKHFMENFNGNCSLELYRREVKKKNISFAKLGLEECETCEHFKIHKNETAHDANNNKDCCRTCLAFHKHEKNYIAARKMYAEAKELKKKGENDTCYFSVDLEKVIMLPRLESFKSVIFTTRLTVFNETFAPLAKATKEYPVVPVLWHEAVKKRNAEDIVSTFYKFLCSNPIRDEKHLVVFMDNCSAQNKNWIFFSFMLYAVNQTKTNLKTLTVIYLETGHTFMSADSFHHSVENAMGSRKLYDFDDFVNVVKNAQAHVNPLQMNIEDFFNFKNIINQKATKGKLKLRDIKSVKVERGKFSLFVKNDYDDVSFTEYNDIVSPKSRMVDVTPCSVPRGISNERKMSILKLVEGPNSVIPINRARFWQELPITG